MNVDTWDVDARIEESIRSNRRVDGRRPADPGVPLEARAAGVEAGAG